MVKKIFSISIVLVLFVFFFLLTPTVSGHVKNVEISPKNPRQGDIINLLITAQPNEEVLIKINFRETVNVSNGYYYYKINDLFITQKPNSFAVRAVNVKTLSISIKLVLWITRSVAATNGIAVISQCNVPVGIYDAVISGSAKKGPSLVLLEFTAGATVKMDDNGHYEYSYPTGNIPPGNFTAYIGSIKKTIMLVERRTAGPE
ncbi:MAG: hypothetical protein JSV88_12585 [Candidatus Aminicenantes bacterium]|nr:MAG: hypothetical protein JSV88_12585 [Candidatus Aminicenantes bacterium]